MSKLPHEACNRTIAELRAALAAAEAALSDERRRNDEWAHRVGVVMQYDARHGGDPGWEPALQDEHKTGPNNEDTFASLLATHRARRAAEVANG